MRVLGQSHTSSHHGLSLRFDSFGPNALAAVVGVSVSASVSVSVVVVVVVAVVLVVV